MYRGFFSSGPGPKYVLRTLTGYKDHCASKFRNPAYTIGGKLVTSGRCDGPGPKYLVKLPYNSPAFTIGQAVRIDSKYRCTGTMYRKIGSKVLSTWTILEIPCGPGPYLVKDLHRGPAFTFGSRTPYRSDCGTPGPYPLKSTLNGPAFTIGVKLNDGKCKGGPGPLMYDINVIKPRAPKFTIARKYQTGATCDGPGPKYKPTLGKPYPMYSFGTKHSECAPPYITECDEKC
ncbi:outer dense fiber protein 3 isoform X1 [Orussus abietinus]|uniref:outer dense fiber protein 3 isoform X1 n=1 Tax=Orussus abietinus TaxID=222816 RepID=UPI000C715FD1|nr:outer dense fiber protein 3 isoform X1 [Orussus abietinus]